MLVEFPDGRALPASARLGAGRMLGNEGGVMRLHILSDAGPRALELEASRQLFGDEGIIERFGKRDNLFEKSGDFLRPDFLVIAAGSFGQEGLFVLEPLRAQPVKMRAPDLQTLAGGGAVHLPGIERLENFTNETAFDTVSQLTFFIAQSSTGILGALPPNPRSFALWEQKVDEHQKPRLAGSRGVRRFSRSTF